MGRRKVIFLGAVGVLVGLAAAALTFLPPRLAREEMRRVARRLDSRVRAREVAGVPGRLTIDHLSVLPSGLSAPLITVERIDVRYGLLPLLWGEVRVDRVDIVRPQFTVELPDARASAAVGRFVGRLRGASRSEGPSSGASALPDVRLTRGSLRLVDRRGACVLARDVEATLSVGGTLRVMLHEIGVGAEPEDPWLVLRVLEAGIAVADRRITHVVADGGTLRLRRHGDGAVEVEETLRRALELHSEILPARQVPADDARAAPLPALRFDGLAVEVDDRARGRRMQIGPVAGSVRPENRLAAAEVALEMSLGTGRASVAGTVDAASGTADLRIELDRAALDPVLSLSPPPPWLQLDGAIATGNLHIATAGAGDETGIEGDLEVSGVDLVVPEVAARPLEDLLLAFHGRLRVRRDPFEIAAPDARVALNGVDASLRGEVLVAQDTAQRGTVDFLLPATPCDALLRRLPEPLVAQLIGFRLQGSFGAEVHVRFDRADLDATELDFDVDNGCRVVASGTGVDRFRGVFTRQVPDGAGGSRPFTTGPGSESWTPFEQISPFLVGAVLTTEDGAFFSHRGFAPRQIREAFVRDLRSGRFSAGASTISMQLAKNVFLSREKTLSRKLQEAFFTWLLEQSMSKEEILELYLNVIEYGPGIYGVRAASDHFFGVAPVALSPVQGIYLATILPDPVGRYAQFERGRVWESTQRRIERIAGHMAARGRLEDISAADALAEPIVFRGQGALAEVPEEPDDSAAN